MLSKLLDNSTNLIETDQNWFLMMLNVGLTILICILGLEAILVSFSIEKIPNIIQNELAIFLTIPQKSINKILNRISEFDTLLNQKFQFTKEGEEEGDSKEKRCQMIQNRTNAQTSIKQNKDRSFVSEGNDQT